MINKIEIDELGVIWRIHYDINTDDLFFEIKHDKVFELYSLNLGTRYKLKNYENYVQNILSIQYPYVLLSYRHIDNLLDDQIITLYKLEVDKEMWLSSDLRVEDVFDNSMKVYHPKISPKSFYYINFEREKIDKPVSFKQLPQITYADNGINLVHLNENETEVNLNFEKSEIEIKHGKTKYVDNFVRQEDYNADYEYLMKINNFVLFILGKHKLNIYRINSINS